MEKQISYDDYNPYCSLNERQQKLNEIKKS